MKKNVFGFMIISLLFIICLILFCLPSMASGCSVSINNIIQHSEDASWPYWAEGNATAVISFTHPENVTFYHFASSLSIWQESTSQWILIGGCSPLDFGDFSVNVPDTPFQWIIGYLREGEYKLELSFYSEYDHDGDSLNCSADAETVFTVLSSANDQNSVTADFTWIPDNPTVFDTVEFQSTSQVANGYLTEYHWSIDGENVPTATGYDTWLWSPTSPGSYTVKLSVTDSNMNTDSISFPVTISATEWYVIDATTSKSVQDYSPWDIIDETTVFSYGDDLFSWVKIANISQGLSVDFVWTDPDFNTVQSTSKQIEDPHSYGQNIWESYVVWDNISVDDALYETIFSTPGNWYVTIYVDGTAERVLDFTITSDRSLSMSVDKTHVITGETVILSGIVTDNSLPVDDTTVDVSIYRKDSLLESQSDILVDSQGAFTFPYTIPVVSFSEDDIEDWSFQVTTDATDPNIQMMTESLSFQVLPVYLELVNVKLVQIIETPDFSDWGGSYRYLAMNRPAILRVILTCPSWTPDFSMPEVTLSFSRMPFTTSTTTIEERSVEVTNEKTIVDLSFTLSTAGSHRLTISVDPAHQYSLPSFKQEYIDSLKWEDEVISKEMKTLLLKFIPVDIPTVIDDPSQLMFIKRQMDFIRDVYPIPKDDISFRYCYRYDTMPYERTKWTLLNLLATKNLIGNYGDKRVVLVGVTPERFWDPGDEGMALGRYITSAVLVKTGSEDIGVTAHEVGHTLGLRTWTEEYDLTNYYTKRYLSGLIQKDNTIINLSDVTSCKQAFPFMLQDVGRTTKIVNFYCMMGNSRYSWICSEDYIDLFNALKDPPNTQSLFVNGWVHMNGSVSLTNCYLLSESSITDPFSQGDYTIEIISTTDEVLYTDTFGKQGDEDDPFSFSIPWYDTASTVYIKKEGRTYAELTPSMHQPQVTILQPTGGRIDSEEFTVAWQGSDADNDQLSYTVFYSHDGENWEIINSETTNTSVEVDTTYLPGGDACQIKVMVTDGFHIDMAETSVFSIIRKKPVCIILNDNDSSFSGIGYDLEDGPLENTDLTWYSDIQGFIGSGDQLPDETLDEGMHQITLKATDSNGNTAEDTTTITIKSSTDTTDESISHVFCVDIDESGSPIGQKTMFSTNEIVYSLITFDEVTAGDRLNWVFSGPNQQQKTETLTFESSGNMYGFAPLDLRSDPIDDPSGEWTVDIYINDEYVLSDTFTVTTTEESPIDIEILFFAGIILVFYLKRKQKNK